MSESTLKRRKLVNRNKEKEKPSGSDGDGNKCGKLEKVSRNKWRITFELPKQTTFSCPVCDCAYNVYSSITRHLSIKHEGVEVEYLFKCCDCDRTFESRKQLGRHVSDNHSVSTEPPPSRKGAYQCNFCEESFVSQRGQAQHERNKHPIRLSKFLATLASQPETDVDEEDTQITPLTTTEEVETDTSKASQPTHWPIDLTNSLIRAMFVKGCSSNIALAKQMNTSKTAHQVGKVKQRILSQYPNWRETFSYLSQDVSDSMGDTSHGEESYSEQSSEAPSSPPEPVMTSDNIETIVLEEGTALQVGLQDGESRETVEVEEPAGSQGEVVNIVIAYPLQVALDCPHCSMKWVGEALEGYIEHLASSHREFTHLYMFVCALCAAHTNTEPEILQHLANEHISDLTVLPESAIKQGKSTLLSLLGHEERSASSSPSIASPPHLSDEDEVPPLPAPLPCMLGFSSPQSQIPLLPGSPVSDAPLPDSSPSTPVQGDAAPQLLFSPISDAPLPNSPVDIRLPARDGSRDETRSLQQKREEEKKALEDLRSKYINHLSPFTDDPINGDQWGEFCTSLDQLCEELKSLVDRFKQKGRPTRGHRTRQWQRRRGGNGGPQRRDRETNSSEGGNETRGRNGRERHRHNTATGKNNGSDRNNATGRSAHRNGTTGRRSNETSTGERRPGSRATGRQRWIQQAKRLQAQYRQNAKNCIQNLLHPNEEREVCNIPLDQIHHQMTEMYANTHQQGDQPDWIRRPERENTDVLDARFTKEEIIFQARRLPARSAPGPDGLTYQNWKALDPKGELLTLILNLCRKAKRIPGSWKKSVTVLAYKNRGDKQDLSSWRPICLQNTIYKLYAACIARELLLGPWR